MIPKLDIDQVVEHLGRLWSEALVIWDSGGWAMYPLALISLLMFGLGTHILLRLRAKRFRSVPERVWRKWIDEPELRRGRIGEMLDFVSGPSSLKEVGAYFEQLQHGETAPFKRDLVVMKVCVSAAPLVGLLGTVTGMLTTFGALSSGSGGEKTMALIAQGISEALITTETGLIIALPGLFFQYQLRRGYERYKTFLAHLESVFMQKLYFDLLIRPRPTRREGIRTLRPAGGKLRRGQPARAV